MNDQISRQAAIDAVNAVFPVDPNRNDYVRGIACGAALAQTYIKQLPSVQLEIISCRDCEYGKQDEYGRWYCRDLGCQIGDEDGSGFCANAERRTDEQTAER